MLAIECTSLTKQYRFGFWGRRVNALQGVDFAVEEGQVFGLIGPNGAGKSTAIKILLDLVRPTWGSAKLFGKDVRTTAAREGVAYVPEAPVPYEHLTGLEYVRLQAALAGVTERDCARTIERVEMGRHASLPIRRYSKGMTQRIMLAGALLGRPRLMVLDEPTSGLDPLGRRLVRDLIVGLRRDGATVLFCTHIISDVESLCDRAALIIGGKVAREGSVSELVGSGNRTHEIIVEHADPAVVRGALGTLATNIESSGGRTFVHVGDEGLQQALQVLISAKLQISRVQPDRFTLEETFLAAIKASPTQVGASLE